MKKRLKKVYDLINIQEWEVKTTLVITILGVAILICMEFYNKFNMYEEPVKNILVCLIGALIGLLGFSLSGIAIIVSLFTREEEKLISEINGKESIKVILLSYSFLAVNIGIQCVVAIFIYLVMSGDMPICKQYFFWILTFVEIYHIVFIIFYTIALVKNCIKLYEIKTIYKRIEDEKKSIHDITNEIKIDYIFSTLTNIYGYTKEEVIENLILFVEDSRISNQEEIVKYIKNQYNK